MTWFISEDDKVCINLDHVAEVRRGETADRSYIEVAVYLVGAPNDFILLDEKDSETFWNVFRLEVAHKNSWMNYSESQEVNTGG